MRERDVEFSSQRSSPFFLGAIAYRLRSLQILQFLVIWGVVAYRWDTNLAGQLVMLTYLPQDITARFTTYFPSLIEFITGAGVVAFGLLGLTIGVRYLNVIDHRSEPEEVATPVMVQLSAVTD